ncbi:MAG: flagellar export protein FliJ [Desulfuromonadales bacterium]|nr:flagellar export protein FliJ [Desulfuromonadales bacterium]
MAAVKQFELEQVLRYRLDIERLRKQEFATAKQGFEHAHEQLKQEEALTRNISQEFYKRQSEMDSIEEIRRYSDFFARKREEIKTQKKRVDHLSDVLNERRETLLDATKDKKVLESLKEKKATEYKQDMDKKEQAFMDEISIQKKTS